MYRSWCIRAAVALVMALGAFGITVPAFAQELSVPDANRREQAKSKGAGDVTLTNAPDFSLVVEELPKQLSFITPQDIQSWTRAELVHSAPRAAIVTQKEQEKQFHFASPARTITDYMKQWDASVRHLSISLTSLLTPRGSQACIVRVKFIRGAFLLARENIKTSVYEEIAYGFDGSGQNKAEMRSALRKAVQCLVKKFSEKWVAGNKHTSVEDAPKNFVSVPKENPSTLTSEGDSLIEQPLSLALLQPPKRSPAPVPDLKACYSTTFATINGLKVSLGDYMHSLERQQVVVSGGKTTTAARLVLDQLIGNIVLAAEVNKEGVQPSTTTVESYYRFRKLLVENQFPGRTFESVMEEQGNTVTEVKEAIKLQLAEANLYEKRLKITDKELRDAYDTFRGEYLPARVQLRLIVADSDSAAEEAKRLLASGMAFDAVAKQVNMAQLKAAGGLVSQATPVEQINAEYRQKVQDLSPGSIIGPVDFSVAKDSPPAKAWIKIERKLAAFRVSFEDARPEVLRQVVQTKLRQPENAAVRDGFMILKIKADFRPGDPAYAAIWNALKQQAISAGVGSLTGKE